MRAARRAAWAVAVIGGGALWACGGSSSSTTSRPTQPGYYIQIQGLAFSPLDLRVPPGATVTVLNGDSMSHSVTSESSQNAFTPGSVSGVSFDTGPFTGNKSFTIPAGVASGTAIPYYCSVHKGTMKTPNGTITIDPSATMTTPPPEPSGPGY